MTIHLIGGIWDYKPDLSEVKTSRFLLHDSTAASSERAVSAIVKGRDWKHPASPSKKEQCTVVIWPRGPEQEDCLIYTERFPTHIT